MAIKLQKITYKNILKEIDCEIEDGKIYTILSLDKLEKDTLSKIIIGSINDYDGKITKSCTESKIKYVDQNCKDIFICDTVYEELKLPINNMKTETINKKIDFILKIMNLDNNIKYTNPNNISSGEKKLLSIGVSLITNPRILIIDEVNDLDDYHKKVLIKLFKKIAKKYNKTIIIFSNDVLFSNEVCDEFILLKEGKIIVKSSKKDLLNIIDKLINSGYQIPKIIEFINNAYKKKNISLNITYDIKELMKDIYRNAK